MSEVQKLKRFGDQNAKLKRVVADLTLDSFVVKDLLSELLTPAGNELRRPLRPE